jgi:TRAP-type mannitol/chloroaromatic compound transport system substrate-binding protein
MAAGGDMLLDSAVAERGLTALIAGHSGPTIGFWANDDVSSIDEFAGSDIRTTGLGRAIVAAVRDAFGMQAATPGAGRLIEVGISPLQAASNPALAPEHRKIWYRQGFLENGIAHALVLSRSAWERFTPGDQLLIQSIASTASNRALAQVKAHDRLIAPAVFARLPIRQEPLAAQISSAIRHVARQTTYDGMAHNRSISQAFQAYGTFYQAMIGEPLSPPDKIPEKAVS